MLSWISAQPGDPEQVLYLQNRAEHPWACMDAVLPPQTGVRVALERPIRSPPAMIRSATECAPRSRAPPCSKNPLCPPS